MAAAAAVAAIADSRVSFSLPSLSFSRSLSLTLSRYSLSLFLFPSICIPPSFRYSPNYPFSSFPVVFSLDFLPRPITLASRYVVPSAQCLEGIHIVLSVFYDLHLVQTRRNVVPLDATTCQRISRVLTIYRCNNNTWNLTAKHCSLKI